MHFSERVSSVTPEIHRFWIAIIVIFAALGTTNGIASEARLNYLHPSDLFSKCQNDCSVTLLAGGSLTPSTIAQLVGFREPRKWEWDSVSIAGGAISRTIVSYEPYFSIDIEGGAAKRFGDSHEAEFWGASYLRWKYFPWNDIIYTTFGISTGVSYATGISNSERRETGGGTRLLHYFSPEITFAAPGRKDIELVVRLHHRSGMFGLFSGVHEADHFGTMGLRYKF